MATYHVQLRDPATAAVNATVDVSGVASPLIPRLLTSYHGKLGYEFAFPTLAGSNSASATDVATAQTALQSVATACGRYGQSMIFVSWDG